MNTTKSIALTDRHPLLCLGLLFCIVLLLASCGGRRADRIAFDGAYFRSNASALDKKRHDFEVSVKPVSLSITGARAAGDYEATRYCIENFGTSDIRWSQGPDAEDGTLLIDNDALILSGTCEAR